MNVGLRLSPKLSPDLSARCHPRSAVHGTLARSVCTFYTLTINKVPPFTSSVDAMINLSGVYLISASGVFQPLPSPSEKARAGTLLSGIHRGEGLHSPCLAGGHP